jgi:hypothetical protein
MQVSDKAMHNQQAYEARGVITKFESMGHFSPSYLITVPIYKYLTLDRGANMEAQPVKFLGAAPVIEDKGETILDLAKLSEGDIVIHPGLVYRKCPWFDELFAAHIKALPNYKPKTIMVADKGDEPAFDLGTIDTTKDQVTKSIKK